jgi:hypothetical protein
MLKPVICLHFPAPAQLAANSSTLQLKRGDSVGSNSSGGQGSRGWWGGSGGKWSDLTVHAESKAEPIEIEFVDGKFALPTLNSVSPRSASSSGDGRRKSWERAEEGREGDTDDSGSTDDSYNWFDSNAVCSGTRKGLPDQKLDGSLSVVVSGTEDDIPQAGKDKVKLVGGTIVVRGVYGPDGRKSIEKVLQYLVSHANVVGTIR